MHLRAVIVSICLWVGVAGAQTKTYSFYELYELDSIAAGPAPSSHFAELYSRFLQRVEKKLERADSFTRTQVRHFEQVFARFYIDACIAFRDKTEIPLPAWRRYFTDTSLLRVQYFLLGANAHLNGGLAEAIAESYTPENWRKLKPHYVLFNSCLNETLAEVYDETIAQSSRAKWLSILSLGLTRPASRYYLYKWRKRQMRVTELYFTGDPGFDKLSNKIQRKKDKIDEMIIRNVK